MRQVRVPTQAFLLLCSGFLIAFVQNASVASLARDKISAKPTFAKGPVIVVGFAGGFVRHDNAVHRPVQLAAHLRDSYPSGVYVEVFENRRREQAHQRILKILDADHDGTLSEERKRDARIVIYGMS